MNEFEIIFQEMAAGLDVVIKALADSIYQILEAVAALHQVYLLEE